MAYEIPPELVAELTDWTLHFLDQGDDVEQAHEHACAAVRGVYLRDEQTPGAVTVVDAAPFFVARPLETVPSASLPPFCWADVVPLPPATGVAASGQGRRGHDGEPHPNGPADVGGVQGGWRAT